MMYKLKIDNGIVIRVKKHRVIQPTTATNGDGSVLITK